MIFSEKPTRSRVIFILTIGIFSIATASIFIRLANEAAGLKTLGFSLVLAASRLTLAALILVPSWRKIEWDKLQKNAIIYAILAGISLAFHFALWITSLSYTTIAASTTLVTTNPVWVALISWWWFGEKISSRQIMGITIALLGAIVIGLSDLHTGNIGNQQIFGDILALIASVAVSFYLLLGREAQRQGFSISGYIAIAYSSAAIVLLPLPFLCQTPYTGYPFIVYIYILLTALIPQMIGHTSFNWAMRWLSPTLVTLAILFEPIGASFLGYLLFREIPSPMVLLGAPLLLLGIAIAALKPQKDKI
jgi:drug/metabolite transporter (DMT)-like permease